MERLKDYIAFDLEFTSFEEDSQIIQVSAVRFKQGQEVAHFDSFVNTDHAIPSFISGLTGITLDQIQAAPKIDTVMNEFKDFVGDLPLIGYNALKSDLPLLKANNLDLDAQYQIDVYEEARNRRDSYLAGSRGLSLQAVANYFKIKGRGHNSLNDARMTALVYEKLLELEENESYLQQANQELIENNPFANLSALFPVDK